MNRKLMGYKLVTIFLLLSGFGLTSMSQENSNFKSNYHDLSYAHRLGLCHGYHVFWMDLSARNGHNMDSRFSKNTAQKILSIMKDDIDSWSASRAVPIMANDAMKKYPDKGATQIKSFAGVCVELGYPIGQNTHQ